MFRQKHITKWLLAAFAAETLCATYGLKLAAHTAIVSIIYFAAGIFMAFLIVSTPAPKKNGVQLVSSNKLNNYSRYALFIVMVVMACIVSRFWFFTIPIDIDYADMLPVIKVMNERFVAGQWKHVYDTIPEIWNGISPVYLPAMWLPFSPAIFFNFDMRWVSVACLVFGFGVFLFRLDLSKKSFSSFIALITAGILFWWLFAENDVHGLLSLSEEGVVILYYTLLVLALFSGNIVLIGIAASLCMLSRYALIGWIPAFIIYLLLNKKRKELFVFVITGAISFLILFILPFGWNAFIRLLELPGRYVEFSGIVWKDSREVFWLSLGFAKFFGAGRAVLLHNTLIISTFVVPLIFVAFCYYRSKQKKISNIPMALLKVSLVIFYNFIDVPYLYLFYTSSFVSLIIVAFLIRAEPHPRSLSFRRGRSGIS
jgi:hypothetical protein